jgi:hypothetical protein
MRKDATAAAAGLCFACDLRELAAKLQENLHRLLVGAATGFLSLMFSGYKDEISYKGMGFVFYTVSRAVRYSLAPAAASKREIISAVV